MILKEVGRTVCSKCITMQKINAQQDLAVYGTVTNGNVWQFGQLLGNKILQPQYTLSDMDGSIYCFVAFFCTLCSTSPAAIAKK